MTTTIQNEKPELEVQKIELLRKEEEEFKIELTKLEDQLLEVYINFSFFFELSIFVFV